tara:strand:- start:1596 stop:2342 length:747 start_codon:yes stop_codon:yes gene_type:complete
VSLTQDEIEEQLRQLADALENMSEITATALEGLDQQIRPLFERGEKLENHAKAPFIQSMTTIGPSKVRAKDLDIWIVSHGGVASNAICDYLEKTGLRTRPENYGLICHKQHPGAPLNIPILVLYGDYDAAIKSMARRKYLSANATKMRFGLDIPELSLRRLISSFPEDPLGIIGFLNSFKIAKEDGLDDIEFLRYPFTNQDAKAALARLGLDVSMDAFVLRKRKINPKAMSSDIMELLEKYDGLEFNP